MCKELYSVDLRDDLIARPDLAANAIIDEGPPPIRRRG